MAEHHPNQVHTESVVLDIGEDAGAVIFYTCDDLGGMEIEIVPTVETAPKTHTEVSERIFNGERMYTGVFPPLPVGEYRVCRPDEHEGQVFTIAPGYVTEIDWR